MSCPRAASPSRPGASPEKAADLYGFLDREIGAGRQVYIVCPAIEDTPDGGLNAVKSYYEDIAKALLPDRRVGLMHGKLKPKEKAAVMDDFKAGRLDALVSTTVIEVGVDVPNATVMVIENAERYGLSALHQLRGRVGRGVPPRAGASLSATTPPRASRSDSSSSAPPQTALPWRSSTLRPAAPATFSAADSTACPPCRSPT